MTGARRRPRRTGGRPTAGTATRAGARTGLVVLAGSTGTLLAATVLAVVVGLLEKAPCWSGGAWGSYPRQLADACYTDIYPLYFTERLVAGKVPYLGHHVEYPVLVGAAMQAVAAVVRPVAEPQTRGSDFFFGTVALLAVCAFVGVFATARAAGRDRRWTMLLVVLAPGLVLTAFINWDLIAVAFAALGLAAWAARRGALAGVLLGLGAATKFYPVLLFGPLFVLCLRAGCLRRFWVALGSGALAWLVVDVPVLAVAPTGWATFYRFSDRRGAGYGSIWYVFERLHAPLLGTPSVHTLNALSAGTFGAACAAIAVLALTAPRRARLPQLCFLVVAAFVVTNKVWSPQYVIWLLPLAVLARPRWWPYLLWQAAEVACFFGTWGYLLFRYQSGLPGVAPAGLGTAGYFAVLLARLAAVLLLCGYVVWDVRRPERDVVRSAGADDPAGGVLTGRADRFVLRRPRLLAGGRAAARFSRS